MNSYEKQKYLRDLRKYLSRCQNNIKILKINCYNTCNIQIKNAISAVYNNFDKNIDTDIFVERTIDFLDYNNDCFHYWNIEENEEEIEYIYSLIEDINIRC
jgi:septation ring formation regulator EzrA